MFRSIAIDVSDFVDKFHADADQIIDSLIEEEVMLMYMSSIVDVEAQQMACEAQFAQLEGKASEAAALLAQIQPEALAPVLAHAVDSPITVERAEEWIRFTMAKLQYDIEDIAVITFFGRQELAHRVDVKRQWIGGSLPVGEYPEGYEAALEAIATEKMRVSDNSDRKLARAGRIYGFPVVGHEEEEDYEDADEADELEETGFVD